MYKGGGKDPITNDLNLWPLDSEAEMLIRAGGIHIYTNARITGTGTVTTNVMQVVGTVIVTNQWAHITSVVTLTNLTNMYADLWDGTVSVPLTKTTTASLSGAPVGTFFTKDKVASEPYTILMADQCRMGETLEDRKSGRPFTIVQKNGVNTYIRFIYTTTDNPVDFNMDIHFEFIPVNSSTLVFL